LPGEPEEPGKHGNDLGIQKDPAKSTQEKSKIPYEPKNPG